MRQLNLTIFFIFTKREWAIYSTTSAIFWCWSLRRFGGRKKREKREEETRPRQMRWRSWQPSCPYILPYNQIHSKIMTTTNRSICINNIVSWSVWKGVDRNTLYHILIRVEFECILHAKPKEYMSDYDNDSEQESAYMWPYSIEILVDEVKNRSCSEWNHKRRSYHS